MSSKNLTGIDAKVYDRIANRIALPHTTDTVKRQLEDSYANIERTLEKEGHTGKLTSPDGLIHLDPVPYKGFTIELYGRNTMLTRFDIYGTLMWIGTATADVVIKGQNTKIVYDIECAFPQGIRDTEDAMKFLIGLIDSYRNNKN